MEKIDMQIDEFMIYCQSKNLSKKIMLSYEQTLRLFATYLKNEKEIVSAIKVTLSKILGHSSVTVTEKVYLDLTDDDIRKSYQNFSPLANLKKNRKQNCSS